jgi:hypothetical protein
MKINGCASGVGNCWSGTTTGWMGNAMVVAVKVQHNGGITYRSVYNEEKQTFVLPPQ